MRWKYRYLITSFAGTYKQDEVDTFLLSLKKTVKRIESLLQDKAKCNFIPVCIPEAMAISETTRLLADLEDFNIKARQIVINHVMVSEDCSFCKQRKAGQTKYIQQINEIYSELDKVEIPEFAEEIQGLKSLKELIKFLF